MVKVKTLYLRTRRTWNIDGSTLLSGMLKRDYGLVSSCSSYILDSRAITLLVCVEVTT